MTAPFRDVQFLTAAQKRGVLRAWVTFLRHGCQPQHFTRALYGHLTLHCSFIAHFSREGFYGVYFGPGNEERALRFLDQFDPAGRGLSVEYGSDWWLTAADYADINQAMRDAAAPFLRQLRIAFSERSRDAELALAAALAAKHGRRLADG